LYFSQITNHLLYDRISMTENWHLSKLEEQDLRLTESRELILSILSKHMSQHLTVEEIYMKVHSDNPSIGMATVYRTMDLLVNHGLAQKFEFGEGKARYELVPSPEKPGHHHHLVCKNCQKIINYDDFMDEEKQFLQTVEQGLEDRYDFQVTNHQIIFYGICEKCQES